MHVAMLSPVAWRTPPRDYGPWELVVSMLTEGLVKRGVKVTLFATADSQTAGKLQAICPQGYEENPEIMPKVWECLHISELFERAAEFDLIHNQFDFLPLSYSRLINTPVVTTIHGFSSPKILPVYKKYNDTAHYVAVSEADRSPELVYEATVYHGIRLEQFTLNEKKEDYLLFYGRFHWDKGAKEAIEIARRAGMKLILAGLVQDEKYFQEEVAPHIDGEKVVYKGVAGAELRDELLGGARTLLHPINFEEPFGLAVVESMACGTPVIAFNKGSMPELIQHGKNGFLVDNIAEAVEVIKDLGDIDPNYCRRYVEERFTIDKMVEGYLKVYERVLEKSRREDKRPWGYYRVLSDEPDHKVKRIVVFPGKRLSLQRHQRRDEHWHVIDGDALVTMDQEQIPLKKGGSVDIPRNTAHRVENTGTENMAFIEVQEGDYFGEDDIERLEDDFGRA
ncbi:MAG: glycosyltransferase [bacterium]